MAVVPYTSDKSHNVFGTYLGFYITVHIMDSRAALSLDMGLHMGIMLRALLQSFYRIHVLGLTRNTLAQ